MLVYINTSSGCPTSIHRCSEAGGTRVWVAAALWQHQAAPTQAAPTARGAPGQQGT